MKSAKALFVPLQTRWFNEFAAGRKRIEYRVHGPRWNRRVCWDGRYVVIAHGYGWPRLHARIVRTSIVPAHRAPMAARELFGARELIAIHVDNVRQIERGQANRFTHTTRDHTHQFPSGEST